jgi:hypothetical protein
MTCTVTQRDLYCTECGTRFTIYRRKDRLKEAGHIKHLYCYVCKARTKHIEGRDCHTGKELIGS